jgi:hypothetical protein
LPTKEELLARIKSIKESTKAIVERGREDASTTTTDVTED